MHFVNSHWSHNRTGRYYFNNDGNKIAEKDRNLFRETLLYEKAWSNDIGSRR